MMTVVSDDIIRATGHIFSERDGLLIPGPLSGGPWDADHQHGGPVSGILAHLVEQVPSDVPMRTARHTVDMMRGVPLTPLRPEVEVVRAGRRIQVVRASIFAGDDLDVEVARATSLRIRVSGDPNPVDPDRTFHEEDALPPMPDRAVEFEVPGIGVPAFLRSIEFRQANSYRSGAPGLAWLRMHSTMVEGHETSGFVRLATLGDMASMVAQYLDPDGWVTINADLSVAAFRDPVGDWIGIRGLHKNDGDGIGLSEAVLYDGTGRVGRATASILISPR